MDLKEETLVTHDENADGERKGKVSTDEASVSNEVDPEKLEEALKQLEEVFCFLPRLLIRRILCRDDVKGDLEKASQQLQEFQGIENPKEQEAEHCHGDAENHEAPCDDVTSEKSSGQKDCKVMGIEKSESEKQSNQGSKRRRRRKKNTKHNEMQMSVEKNEFEESSENEFYQQECFRGRGFRGRPRGAQTRAPNRGQRGGPYGVPRGIGRGGFYFQHQHPRHQDNLNTYGYPAQNKPNPNWGMREVYGGRPVWGPWVENAHQRRNVYRNRGRGHRGRHDGLVSLENLEESGENLGPFEQNKLAVSGLNASTTEEGVLNFIGAMSGEEVEEVSMLGNGKALVTMVEPITGKDFTRINNIFLS